MPVFLQCFCYGLIYELNPTPDFVLTSDCTKNHFPLLPRLLLFLWAQYYKMAIVFFG